MAQTGYTPILIYSTSTAAAVPTAGSLTNSTLGSELAINITDGKLFYKDNANAIQVIGWKTVPVSAGGTGLTSLTANGILYASGTSSMATSSALTFNGTNFATTGSATATAFIPSGSSVPSNGMYLPAANTVAWSINSAEAMRLASGRQLLIGSTALNQIGSVAGILQLETANAATNFTLIRNTANSAAPIIAFGKSRGAAASSRTAVISGDLLGVMNFSGADGTNMVDGAYIAAAVDGTPGTNDMPGRLLFATTADGASSPTERMRIFASGGVSIGDTTDPGAGNLRLGTGNLVIGTSGKGIDFSATAGTGDSELLADYEEGTFNPTLITNGTGFTSVTYSTERGGRYVKVGNFVHVQLTMRTSAVTKGSASGDVLIGGLPFTAVASSGSTQDGNAVAAGGVSVSWLTNNVMFGVIQNNSTSILLYINQAATTATVANVGTGSGANYLQLSGTYEAA